jgi:hypothetical protein
MRCLEGDKLLLARFPSMACKSDRPWMAGWHVAMLAMTRHVDVIQPYVTQSYTSASVLDSRPGVADSDSGAHGSCTSSKLLQSDTVSWTDMGVEAVQKQPKR